MNKIKIYDLPTRFFHWLFAALFLGAFFVAKVIDDESPIYAYHMLLGLVLALTVVLRIIWGVIGSRYARFSSLTLKPSALFQYFKQLLTGKTARTLGHNAASSWAALIMMALALGLAVTGFMMTTGGNKEVLEDVHELLANVFIVVVIAHVSGVILHTLRHRDFIALAMVNGKKQTFDEQTGIDRSYRGVGLLFLAIIGTFVFHLSRSYDVRTQSLHLFGNTLQLGESVKKEQSKAKKHHDRDHQRRKHRDRDSD